VGILPVLRKDFVKAEKGNPILGPLHTCPVLSLDRLRCVKEFQKKGTKLNVVNEENGWLMIVGLMTQIKLLVRE
jgi:hypothetical protein